VREHCTDDAHEHDDGPDAARHVRPGDPHTEHALCDPDWLTFPAEAGRWYRVETFGLQGSADTVIELWGGHGEALLLADDDGSPTPQASRLDFQAPDDADLHVLVAQRDGAYGGRRGYSVQVRAIAGACVEDGDCAGDAFCRDGECIP
jgi:hypothetical protein